MNKITESPGHYRHLEKMSTVDLLTAINQEDQQVAQALAQALPAITALVEVIAKSMQQGGRLFYVDMQLSNDKLVDRGIKMVIEATGVSYEIARALLLKHGSVRGAIEA